MLKIIRFFDLQPNLLILRESVVRGISDLSTFTVMLMTMMFGFCLAASNIFGQESNSFLSLDRSFTSLFLMVLGEFDYEELEAANDQVGTIIFILFMLLFVFILLNLIIAILMDSYKQIRRSDEIALATRTTGRIEYTAVP